MKYLPLAQTGEKVSFLGLGGLHFGVLLSREESIQLIHQAVDLGINFIDTAPIYGSTHSESIIGDALKASRAKVLLSTKVGLRATQNAGGQFSVAVAALNEDHIFSSVHESLKAMKTDCIDLLQLHAYDPSTPLAETLQVLETLRQQGKIRWFGVSNYEEDQWAELVGINSALKPVSFQVHYNILERRSEKKLLPTCMGNGVSVLVNRALGRGVFTEKYLNENDPIPPASRAASSPRIKALLQPATLTAVRALWEFCAARQKPLAALPIAWLAAQKNTASALVGVRNKEQLQVLVQALEWQLTGTDIEEIDKRLREVITLESLYQKPEIFFER